VSLPALMGVWSPALMNAKCVYYIADRTFSTGIKPFITVKKTMESSSCLNEGCTGSK